MGGGSGRMADSTIRSLRLPVLNPVSRVSRLPSRGGIRHGQNRAKGAAGVAVVVSCVLAGGTAWGLLQKWRR
jgi:hypothetical protein